jgi:uncharacterized OsmC-like protein
MKNLVTLSYQQGLHCETVSPDGQAVMSIDPATRKGQPGYGFSPLDLLALAHGACTAMMLAKAADRLQLDVKGMQVEVSHEYDLGPPMRLCSARIRFVLPCRLSREQAVELQAGAELCPVHTSLRPDITVDMELVQPV